MYICTRVQSRIIVHTLPLTQLLRTLFGFLKVVWPVSLSAPICSTYIHMQHATFMLIHMHIYAIFSSNRVQLREIPQPLNGRTHAPTRARTLSQSSTTRINIEIYERNTRPIYVSGRPAYVSSISCVCVVGSISRKPHTRSPVMRSTKYIVRGLSRTSQRGLKSSTAPVSASASAGLVSPSAAAATCPHAADSINIGNSIGSSIIDTSARVQPYSAVPGPKPLPLLGNTWR